MNHLKQPPWHTGQMVLCALAVVAQLYLPIPILKQLADEFGMSSANAGYALTAFSLSAYGLEKGCHADFVLLQARDPVEALRLRATRLKVYRRGKLVAQTPAPTADAYAYAEEEAWAWAWRNGDRKTQPFFSTVALF
jgi:cytosine/adenosine deaminase-related metal-dependent hydrolase